MRKPNMMEAKKRTRAEIKVIRDAYIVPSSINNIGIDKKYFLRTYGCQMNVHDSENIKGELEELGYTEIDNYEDADLIIINTCAIRENAHNKVFGFLGRLKHLKKQKPNILVGLCGCMAQEEAVVNEIIDKYQWLDFVFGTHNIHELPQILKQHLDLKQLIVEVPSNEGNIYENIPVKRDHPFKAWVNIMYGCDKFCTYCIVPYTRGKQRSRRPEDIINEVKDLIKKGYLEVTLLGQNVNAYGKDFTGLDYNMATLLKDISKLPIKRIRFLTSHPWDFTKEMILVIKNNSNIMPHFHLPIQAGSNKVLK